MTPEARDAAFRTILGWEPNEAHFGRPDQFKIPLLNRGLQPNAQWNDFHVHQYTAQVIYEYLGGLLFPDTSERFAPTDFVLFLDDFDRTSQYSWGSAVLARLYNSLCHTALKKNDQTRPGGCLLLLQLWAWSRLLPLRPEVKIQVNYRHRPPAIDEPHGSDLQKFTLAQPDRVFVISETNLMVYCIIMVGQALWSYEGVVIYRLHVEPIMPKRFTRQFGKLQTIPELPFPYRADHHRPSGTGSLDAFTDYVRVWRDDRLNHVILDEMVPRNSPLNVGDDLAAGYRDWFAFFGRHLIRNPAHHHERGAESSATALISVARTLVGVRDSLDKSLEEPNTMLVTVLNCRDLINHKLDELSRNEHLPMSTNFEVARSKGYSFFANPSSIYSYMVDLENRVCTCGRWSSDAVPCVHVHAVFRSKRQVADNLIPPVYSVQNYLQCYSGVIHPVIFQPNLDIGDFRVNPPIRPEREIPRSGRRKRNRYISEMDRRVTRGG
ncbi:hypothetical protein DM860_010292 [Cuscuta australis]|uniref:SWIM-type domain-containing protein n=1 Tax=Cuscuta australis TaxID=267555 RepID=A0A328DAM9_9ASTE|nr:hypothetical protein DM860_010292 [Cuscuta australis]